MRAGDQVGGIIAIIYRPLKCHVHGTRSRRGKIHTVQDWNRNRLLHHSSHRWQTNNISPFTRDERSMGSSNKRGTGAFQQHETLPLVYRMIHQLSAGTDRFITHDMLVGAILQDSLGLELATRAADRSESFADARAAAANFVAWFSQKYTQGANNWEPLLDRRKIDSRYAYRLRSHAALTLWPDPEILSAIEGEPRLVEHFRRERDRSLVALKKRHALRSEGVLRCEACGFRGCDAYVGIDHDVFEVHHLRPLSATAGPVRTELCDLAVLCANCHRAIHRTRPLMDVDTFSKFHCRGRRADGPRPGAPFTDKQRTGR